MLIEIKDTQLQQSLLKNKFNKKQKIKIKVFLFPNNIIMSLIISKVN